MCPSDDDASVEVSQLRPAEVERWAGELARAYVIAAHAGASYLDDVVQEQPPWRTRVDLERLDLRCVTACVLGQLYGTYINGLDALALSTNDARKLGFIVHDDHVAGSDSSQEAAEREFGAWQALTRSWREELTA